MDPIMTVATPGIEQLFKDLAELTGKTPGRLVRERCGAVARYFATATQPYGDDLSAKKQGQAAVTRDIRRVYVPIQRVYADIERKIGKRVARAFAAKVRKDPAAAAELLRQCGLSAERLDFREGFDGGALHRSKRNARGRVNRGTKPVIVTDARALKDYVKATMKRVGWAKSAWITAVRMIKGVQGLSGIPTWMRQPAPGRGLDRTGGDDPEVEVLNDVKYLDDLVRSHDISGAQKAFEASLAKEIENVTAKIAKKNAAVVTTT